MDMVETYGRKCPYCEEMRALERFARLGEPCGMSQPAIDCPVCGYVALPRRLWPAEWK